MPSTKQPLNSQPEETPAPTSAPSWSASERAYPELSESERRAVLKAFKESLPYLQIPKQDV